MGHNSVVSGYPKSTGISRVDRLSTGLSGFGASHYVEQLRGYEKKGSEHKVYKLHKALYGLK